MIANAILEIQSLGQQSLAVGIGLACLALSAWTAFLNALKGRK